MGIDRVKKEDIFERDEGRGRGHSMKLFKERVRPGWILPSTASPTECVTSGTNCQLKLYHPKA